MINFGKLNLFYEIDCVRKQIIYRRMKRFIHKNFLLQTDTAKELYHEHAKKATDHRLSLSPGSRAHCR